MKYVTVEYLNNCIQLQYFKNNTLLSMHIVVMLYMHIVSFNIYIYIYIYIYILIINIYIF